MNPINWLLRFESGYVHEYKETACFSQIRNMVGFMDRTPSVKDRILRDEGAIQDITYRVWPCNDRNPGTEGYEEEREYGDILASVPRFKDWLAWDRDTFEVVVDAAAPWRIVMGILYFYRYIDEWHRMVESILEAHAMEGISNGAAVVLGNGAGSIWMPYGHAIAPVTGKDTALRLVSWLDGGDDEELDRLTGDPFHSFKGYGLEGGIDKFWDMSIVKGGSSEDLYKMRGNCAAIYEHFKRVELCVS